jgi:hypothetical protein
MTLVQTIQGLKDLGAPPKVVEAFLRDTMQLDDEQAKLYSSIVSAPSPAGADEW